MNFCLKVFCVSILTAFGSFTLFAQDTELLWAHGIGNALSNQTATDVAVDAEGNVYLSGLFDGTIDFDPGVNTVNLVSNGFRDCFIQKFDQNGNLIWAKSYGGSGYDLISSIDIDDNGDLIILGEFQNTVDFDPGVGVLNYTSNGGYDFFVQKLDSAGAHIWTKTFGGIQNDYSGDVVTSLNNIYVTGYFGGSVDFDPGPLTTNLITSGGLDIFVLKLDSDAGFFWAKNFGDIQNDFGSAITIDFEGNILVAGGFEYSVDFDPGPAQALLISNGSLDGFILKLSDTGTFISAMNVGGDQQDLLRTIAVDAENNVFAAGFYTDSMEVAMQAGTLQIYSIGSRDPFIIKCDSGLNELWVQTFGSTNHDDAFSIDVDVQGEVVMCGYLGESALIVAGNSSTYIQPLNSYLQKFDADGNFLWTKTITSAIESSIKRVLIDQENQIYCVGYFQDTADFDMESTTYNIGTNGGNDIFIQKLGHCLSFSVHSLDSLVYTNDIGLSYQWLDCDNSFSIIPSATDNQFFPNQTGNYAVVVSQNICADTSNCISIIITDSGVGMNENQTSSLIVYPNPVNNTLYLNEIFTFKILNSVGEVVLTATNTNKVDVCSLSKGIYLIITENGITKKFIKA